MTESRTLRVDGPEWARLQDLAAPTPGDELAETLAGHRAAPVRAALVAANQDRGVRTELSLRGEKAVLVTRRLARADGRTRVEPGAQVTFSTLEGLWPALARTLPDVPQLRAPASAAGGRPDRVLDLSHEETTALVSREDLALQVVVEAWTDAEVPRIRWARQWSVTGDRLLDVRTHSGGTLELVERPAGSVAAELRWALVGAMDATSARGPTGSD